MGDLLFDWFGLDQTSEPVVHSTQAKHLNQTGQSYSVKKVSILWLNLSSIQLTASFSTISCAIPVSLFTHALPRTLLRTHSFIASRFRHDFDPRLFLPRSPSSDVHLCLDLDRHFLTQVTLLWRVFSYSRPRPWKYDESNDADAKWRSLCTLRYKWRMKCCYTTMLYV